MTYDVQWETLEFVGGNSNKFYRAYHITSATGGQSWSLVQWGGQRSGVRSGGQAKLSGGRAMYANKLDEKRREGYTGVDQGSITVDDSVIGNGIANDDAKGLCSRLEGALRQGASAPSPTQARTCPDCAEVFNGQAALDRHKASVHDPFGTPDPAPVIAKHPIESLAQRALSALGLASADPHAAIVEAAKIRADLAKELEVVGRVESYLKTLDLLVDEEA